MVTVIKERPILFKPEMVRAYLAGLKTQTRRIMNPQPVEFDADDWGLHDSQDGDWWSVGNFVENGWCPYGIPGDRLWVRESWRLGDSNPNGLTVSRYAIEDHQRHWRVPSPAELAALSPTAKSGKGVPSIHMPRWASRIDFPITGIRTERVQDISHHDAIQEGLIEWTDPPRVTTLHYGLTRADCWETDPRLAYKRLWIDINGQKSWDENPWIWVVEFPQYRAAD